LLWKKAKLTLTDSYVLLIADTPNLDSINLEFPGQFMRLSTRQLFYAVYLFCPFKNSVHQFFAFIHYCFYPKPFVMHYSTYRLEKNKNGLFWKATNSQPIYDIFIAASHAVVHDFV